MSTRKFLILALLAFFLGACAKQQEQQARTLREGLHAAVAGDKHEEALSLYMRLREIDQVTDEETLEVVWRSYFCLDNLDLALDTKDRVKAATENSARPFPEVEYHHLYARVSCESGIASPCHDHAKAALAIVSENDGFPFYESIFRPELEQMLMAVNSDAFQAMDRSVFDYEPCSESWWAQVKDTH